MIFPIPKKETYSDGRYAVSAALADLSLVDIFAAVKEGKTEVAVCTDTALSGEAHKISIDENGVKIAYATEEGLFRAVTSLWQLLRKNGADLPYAEIEDAPTLARRGYMLDISRGRMPKVETFKKIIDFLASVKYNELQIYMEGHVFKFASFPQYTADFDCLNAKDIKELQAYCHARFIDLVPNQNSFGHMYQWLKNPELSHLAVAPEGGKGGTINPLLPESLAFIDKLYSDLLPYHESEYVNVGFDEAYGLGRYQLEEPCKKYGRATVFMDWLNKVADLCKDKYGKKVQFWSDMIHAYPETYDRIPKGAIALEWGYELGAAQRMAENCVDYKRAGIDFYLCPSTNTHLAFTGRNEVTVFNIRTSATIAEKYGAKGLLLTDWGCDCGQPTFLLWSAFPVALAGQYAWNPGTFNPEDFKPDYNVAAEQYVDEVVFKTEGVSEILRRIANYYLLEPDRVHCGTMCGQSLQMPLGEMNFRGIFDFRTRPHTHYFENVINYVKGLVSEIEKVQIDPFYKEQIILNARMVVFAASFNKIRLGEIPDASGIQALIDEADAIDAAFIRLWDAENYAEGKMEFLSQLRGRRADLVTLLASKE
ncbi:MAG: family 20 glycosylhydrolase [Clostridia bacterium]|nr:family 20 glycosylhydrolase [Clostridia bacterium]